MSSTISLGFGDFVQAASKSRSAPPLRVTLLYEEVLRLPRSSRRLHVVSGIAWVSAQGKDCLLHRGESFLLPKSGYEAVISATGHETLFFEVLRRPKALRSHSRE